MGNYEINSEEGYVRLELSPGVYEYIVSNELFDNYSYKATRLFEHAYLRGQSDLRRNIRGLLNT